MPESWKNQSLAQEDRYQFQWWALGPVVDARPAQDDRKKGVDGGIDGLVRFFDDDTHKMIQEALGAGYYTFAGHAYPHIQILTIERLLSGKNVDYPRYEVGTFKKAQLTSKAVGATQGDLFGEADG